MSRLSTYLASFSAGAGFSSVVFFFVVLSPPHPIVNMVRLATIKNITKYLI